MTSKAERKQQEFNLNIRQRSSVKTSAIKQKLVDLHVLNHFKSAQQWRPTNLKLDMKQNSHVNDYISELMVITGAADNFPSITKQKRHGFRENLVNLLTYDHQPEGKLAWRNNACYIAEDTVKEQTASYHAQNRTYTSPAKKLTFSSFLSSVRSFILD